MFVFTLRLLLREEDKLSTDVGMGNCILRREAKPLLKEHELYSTDIHIIIDFTDCLLIHEMMQGSRILGLRIRDSVHMCTVLTSWHRDVIHRVSALTKVIFTVLLKLNISQ